MQDDQDPVLRRLFAEQERSRPSDEFMTRLGRQIDARQRSGRVRGIVAIAACLVLSALVAPLVAEGASRLVDLAVAGFRSGGLFRRDSLTWLVACATVLGWSPVIYLWRTGRW